MQWTEASFPLLTPSNQPSIQPTDPTQHDTGLWIRTIYGGVPYERQIRDLESGFDILVGTPGACLCMIYQVFGWMGGLWWAWVGSSRPLPTRLGVGPFHTPTANQLPNQPTHHPVPIHPPTTTTTTPTGRIMDHLDRGTLSLSNIRHVILDEADEMLKMGFAEDIETIFGHFDVTKAQVRG